MKPSCLFRKLPLWQAVLLLPLFSATAHAQPFGLTALNNRLSVMNLATGAMVVSHEAATDVRFGESAFDATTGHFFVISNVGTFRVRISPPGLEPGLVPYNGDANGGKLRLSADGQFALVCRRIGMEFGCDLLRRSDATIVAAYANVHDGYFTSDSALILMTRANSSSGPFSLRRFELATPSTPTFTVDVTEFARELKVSATTVVVMQSMPERLVIFDASSGARHGELPLAGLQSIFLSNTSLFVGFHEERPKLARYNVTTLQREAVGDAFITTTVAIRASADGTRLYVHTLSVLAGGLLASSISTYDPQTLNLLFIRSVATSHPIVVSTEAPCPFSVNPAGTFIDVPARGGLTEFHVTTEARCGPWEVSPPIGPVPSDLSAVLFGPTVRLASSVVQIATPPRNDRQFGSWNFTLARSRIRLSPFTEITPPAMPVNVAVSVEQAVPTITWSVDDGPLVTSFVLEGGAAGGPVQASLQVPATTRSFNAGPLPSGHYFVQVRAINNVGSSPATAQVVFSVGTGTLPPPPTNLQAFARSSYLRLTWDAGPGLPAASRYVIEAAPAGGSRGVVASTTDSTRAFSVAGAPSGTWDIAVRAVTDAGLGPPSNVVTVSTAPCTAAPTVPTNFRAIVIDKLVTLAWEAPSSGADAFAIEVDSPSGANLARITVPATTTRIEPIAPSGGYAIRVRSVNACGQSLPSSERLIAVP